MNHRNLSALIVASSLFFMVEGCKKKTPAPPPPPAPVAKPAPAPPPARPEIASFTAEPSTIERGQCSNLRWSVSNASEVAISQGVGAVQSSGNRSVCPSSTATYTLSAKGPGGEATSSATVNVTSPPPPPPPPPPPAAPKMSVSDRLARDVQDAYFDYDKSEIREDARAALSRNSDALKAIFNDYPNAVISVEGHCDERGSAEYNLGLGDRRATAARDFLTQLGVPADRLKTISYGKERPQCADAAEECYQKNRRAHFSGQ